MSTANSFDSRSTAPLISMKNGPCFKSGITGTCNARKPSGTLPTQPKPIIKRRRCRVLFSSIGGFGNRYKFEERATASQDEILARRAIQKESKSTIFHYGIGGVGNQTASVCVSSSSVTSSSDSYSIKACPSGADKTKEIIIGLFRRS